MIQKLPIYPAFQENNLPVVLDSSDSFAPYASVTILSVIDHASPEYNYDFLVLTWDMKEETAQKLAAMAEKHRNVSIRVIDVNDIINRYKILAESMTRFNRFGYVGAIRINLPTILKNFDMALHLDSDLVVCADISELFRYDMSDYYIGWVPDVCGYIVNHKPDATVMTDEYMHNRLGLNSAAEYMNGGVFLLHVKNINRDFTQKQIIEFGTEDGALLPFAEQDTFSGLFAGHKLDFPFEWNWQIDDDNKLISNGKRFLPYNDGLLDKYYRAEKDIKCYHYIGNRKPWITAKTAYDEIWWEAARKTVFFNEILGQNTELHKSKMGNAQAPDEKKRLLFVCESPYDLINIINVKYHYYPDVEADLLICSSSISNCIEKVKELNVFQEIIVTEYDSRTNYDEVLAIPLAERTLNPEKFALLPRLRKWYTDYFICFTRHHFLHMIYYSMVNAGMLPEVHVLEDGSATYVDDLNFDDYKDIDQKLYPENKRLQNRLTSLYLYKPSLYCGASKVRIIPLPSLTSDKTELIDMLFSLWGPIELPPQRYIFLNECMREEGKVTNEVQLLDAVSEIVGKENIAIKIHPRSTNMEKTYQMHGYYVMPNSAVPWELTSFSQNMDKKILMSISSNVIWTPLILSGVNNCTISLCEVMKLSRRGHTRTSKYWNFLSKVRTIANKDEVKLYVPNTQLELKNVIRYIEGEA